FHLRNIARIHPMLSLTVAEKLINTFFSQIDYCNALLTGVSKSTLNKLQYVQNSAARILTRSSASNHITPILKSLHWLPVKFPHYTEPVVQKDGVAEGGEAQFNCSSGQGFPEPTVHWLINGERPPVDTVRSTVTQEPDTKLFSVRSLITVNVTQEITVSCTIENHRLKENKTSAVIYLVGGFLIAVLIGVAMWKRRELFRLCGIAQ
ncbi:CD80 protein, partial [Atractosteus spatula]|nr:CD80 protein [Atractosteus spatula]